MLDYQQYKYGEDSLSIASVSFMKAKGATPETINYEKHDFLVYTEDEMQEMIDDREKSVDINTDV